MGWLRLKQRSLTNPKTAGKLRRLGLCSRVNNANRYERFHLDGVQQSCRGMAVLCPYPVSHLNENFIEKMGLKPRPSRTAFFVPGCTASTLQAALLPR